MTIKIQEKLCLVYGLFDPQTHMIRYVGKSCRGFSRAWDHMKPFSMRKDPHSHKTRWIKKLLSQGLRPKPVVLEVCDDKQSASVKEAQWIKDLRFIGIPLTNMTDGGDGTPGRFHSKETKKKQSERAMGRIPWSKGKKIGPNLKARGRKASEQTIEKCRASQKKRYEDPEEKSRLLIQLASEREKRKKPIKDDLGNIYPSVREAAKILGIHAPNITCVLKGRYKQANGRTFTYL